MKTLIEKLIPVNFYNSLVLGYHYFQAWRYALKYRFPGRKMKIIGVTGTNGKTSTCFMIHNMLVESGIKTGLMTTVAYGVDRDIVDQTEHVTTVSARVLQKRLAEFCQQGVEVVVLEVTSHALAQHRVWGVDFTIGVLTNITHEHLDYHRTFERYAAAKIKLFKNVAKNKGAIIVNADDQASMKWTRPFARLTYGIKHGQYRAEKIKLGATSSSYAVRTKDGIYQIQCQIPGEFNIYNSLATVLVGQELGLTKQQIEQGISSLEQIAGRMTVIEAGQKYTVIVDFAHNPDSFTKIFESIKSQVKGKLVVLFGSAGRRDQAKRAIQGQIAAKYADEIILTEEDDRDEDGQMILEQIAAGALEAGFAKDKLFLELDRQKAIKFALTRVKSAKDIVLFLGKGHEKTIERADQTLDWNETKVVTEAIKNSLKKS